MLLKLVMYREIQRAVRTLAWSIALSGFGVTAFAASSVTQGFGPAKEKFASAALAAFLQCNASFFEALKAVPDAFGSDVTVGLSGSSMAPTVLDPLSDKGRVQTFPRPVEVSGMKLIAYRNEAEFDVNMGAFIWWGFDVEGTEESVAQAANRLLGPADRMSSGRGPWSRQEFRRAGDPIGAWRRGGQPNGMVAEKGTVERVLLVEAHEIKGRSKLYCTLQGSVTRPVLQHERPDLPESVMP